ncbi:ABC transporter substrate-binding protein [Actinomadura kijaniata]|uniref:ABC transporter substrate-binding protein n=1 Tax=Actinomadura kijaniata TaxID=46161 RepID=UPI00082E968C|nr:ABC transporter substrate-binding protein [Actinomadura kijaniata]
MPNPAARSLSRRGLLTAGGAVAVGALLAACGGKEKDGAAVAGQGSASGPWTFTDGRGKQLNLPARPKRVVAYVGAAAALWDFGIRDQIIGVYGPAKLPNGRPDPQIGDVDVDKVTVIGNAYGEFNIEKYAALRPELLVDHIFVQDQLFYVPAEHKDKIFAVAPSAGVLVGRVPLPKAIENYAALAASLGADLKAAPVVEAKARFDRAAQAIRDAVKANPGVKVLAGAGMADNFYVSSPAKNSDIMYFKELGVDFVVPQQVDKDGYFEALSWENADKYHADVIMLDARTQSLQPPALASKPTWKDLPAVKNDQVIPWHPEPRFSWAGCAQNMEALANTIKSAKKVR